MPLMQLDTFKNLTKGTRFSRRTNPVLLDMDTMLRVYHDPGSHPQKQFKALVALFFLSSKYLRDGGSRVEGVTTLHQQTETELQSPQMIAIYHERASGVRFKTDGQGGFNKVQVPGKTLYGDYNIETATPKGHMQGVELKSEHKMFNSPSLSRSIADDLQEGMAGDRNQRQAVNTKYGTTFAPDNSGYDDYEQFAFQRVQQMSLLEQLQLMDEILAKDAQAVANGQDGRRSFEYLGKDDRADLRVFVKNGMCYADEKCKQLYNTGVKGTKEEWGLFAMDQFERIYIKKSSEVGGQNFNHSSFMSGKPVVCAGSMLIFNGQLELVSNESGHYRPTAQDLAQAVTILRNRYGQDMFRLKVKDISGARGSGAPEEDAYLFLGRVAAL